MIHLEKESKPLTLKRILSLDLFHLIYCACYMTIVFTYYEIKYRKFFLMIRYRLKQDIESMETNITNENDIDSDVNGYL